MLAQYPNTESSRICLPPSTLSTLEKEEVREEAEKEDLRVVAEMILEEGVLREEVAEVEKGKAAGKASRVPSLLVTNDPKALLVKSISCVVTSKRERNAPTATGVLTHTRRRTSMITARNTGLMPPNQGRTGLIQRMKVSGPFRIGNCVRIRFVFPICVRKKSKTMATPFKLAKSLKQRLRTRRAPGQ
jgi:hypothetical protein